MAHNSIFEDLGIDTSDMFDDPDAFMERVYIKVEEMKDILRQDTSFRAMEQRYKDEAVPCPKDFHEAVRDIYGLAEKLQVNELHNAIKAVRQLVTDMETLYTDKCIYEAAGSNETVSSKRMVHEQYCLLREAVNKYIDAMKVLFALSDYNFKHIAAMPGNYGSGNTTFIHYVFYHADGEYRNHRVVAEKIGAPVGTLMDLTEYIDANPDCGVTYKKA